MVTYVGSPTRLRFESGAVVDQHGHSVATHPLRELLMSYSPKGDGDTFVINPPPPERRCERGHVTRGLTFRFELTGGELVEFTACTACILALLRTMEAK